MTKSDLELYEKIGVISAKIDNVENDLKEIKSALKELNEFMHKSSGWGDSLKYLVSFVGGGTTVFTIIKFLFLGSL